MALGTIPRRQLEANSLSVFHLALQRGQESLCSVDNAICSVPSLIAFAKNGFHWIWTIGGTEIRIYSPFRCAKFQLNWSMYLCFYSNFCKVCKK